MIEIAFSPSFKRAFRKKIRGQTYLQAKFWQKVENFERSFNSGNTKFMKII